MASATRNLGKLSVAVVCAAANLTLSYAQNSGDDTIPSQEFTQPEFRAMPGRVRGILARGIADVLEAEGRSGPDDVLGFSVDRQSYRWIYLPTQERKDAERVVVKVGKEGAERRVYESVQLAVNDVATARKLPEDQYCLVEVEVNDGQGSPPTDRFVATQLRVIEKSDDFPLKVMEAVRDARLRFKEAMAQQEETIAKTVARLAMETLENKTVEEKLETATSEFVSWIPQKRELYVRLTYRATSGEYRTTTGASADDRQSKETQLHRRSVPGIRYGTECGVRCSIEYRFDSKGSLIEAVQSPLQTFVRKLEPPK